MFSFYLFFSFLFFLFPGKPLQLNTPVEVAAFWRPMKSFFRMNVITLAVDQCTEGARVQK